MFINLIEGLRKAGLPVSITEYLALVEAVDAGISQYSVEVTCGTCKRRASSR